MNNVGEAEMTKQEQIEELKNILLEESNRFYGLECDEACAYCEASAVFDAGYRKESKNYIGTDEVLRSIDYRPVEEVRRETAKEILSDIDFNLKISDATKEPKSNDYYNVVGWIEEIAKEYSVEVEE